MSVLDSLRAAMHTRLSDMTESAYRTENWHSATFDGTRHVFRFDVPSDVDVAGFERDIAEADIPLSRGFVADIDVTESSAGQIEVAALIIEAGSADHPARGHRVKGVQRTGGSSIVFKVGLTVHCENVTHDTHRIDGKRRDY